MAAKYPQVLLADRKAERITTLQEYEQTGGYHGLKAALEKYRPSDIIRRIEEANLLGRGGAAFPAGLKLKSVAEDAPYPRYRRHDHRGLYNQG